MFRWTGRRRSPRCDWLGGFGSDAQKCARKGCRAPSERHVLRAGQGMAGSMQPSIHCSSHACEFKDGNGMLCQTPKKKGAKSLCPRHRKCEVAGCHERRRNENKDFKWCDRDHACKVADCKEPRRLVPGSAGLFGFCSSHTCEETGCSEIRINVPNQKVSSRCANHTCRQPFCANQVSGKDPGNGTQQHQYCDQHKTCKVDGCALLVKVVSSGTYYETCDHHCCAFDQLCRDARDLSAPGATTCPKHTCTEPGCSDKIERQQGRLCKNHECKNKLPCLNRRYLTSEFCMAHVCKEWRSGCLKEGEPNRGDCCADHELCSVSGCKKARFNHQGVIQFKCKTHYYGPCAYTGCTRDSEENKKHCADHGCQAETQCMFPRTPHCGFCPLHKCANTQCTGLRSRDKTKTVDWNLFGVLAGGNGVGPGGWSRNAAASLSSSSSSPTASAAAVYLGYATFCLAHECRRPDCLDGAPGPGAFCGPHTCVYPGCEHEATHGLSTNTSTSGGGGGNDRRACSRHRRRVRRRARRHRRRCRRRRGDSSDSDSSRSSDSSSSDDDDDDDGDGDDDDDNGGWNSNVVPDWGGPFNLGTKARRKHGSGRRSRKAGRHRKRTLGW